MALSLRPSKQAALILTVFVVIVVLMSIVYLSRQQPSLEGFADTPLPLEDYNKHQSLGACTRDLAFSNFTNSTLRASYRAIKTDLNTNGSCPNDGMAPIVSPEMAEVEENRIRYLLKSACINLQYKVIDVNEKENSDRITIYFNNKTSSIDNTVNLLYLFLLNPVYVEFEDSDAYIIDYNDKRNYGGANFYTTSYYTNYNQGRILENKSDLDIAVTFRRLVGSKNSSKNPVFNYGPPTQRKAFKDIISSRQNGTINVKAYYLETDGIVSAGIKLDLARVYKAINPVETLRIYNKDFSRLDPSTDEYYFHQRMFVNLQNSENPVLTFKFTIIVPETSYSQLVNRSTEVMKVYMDANIGRYSSCAGYQTIDKNNHNIFSAAIKGYFGIKDNFVLSLSTTNNINNTPCASNKNTTLDLELPFSKKNERITVVFTISASEKVALCRWAYDEREYFLFKRSQVCSTDNNFFQVFNQRSKTTQITNENIIMAYSPAIVTGLSYCQFGQKNYLPEYYPKK